MIGIGPVSSGEMTAGAAIRARLTERHVLALGLALSGLFVAAAVMAAGAALLAGGSPWAAIHLALAGAATVAIGTFMPHFAVTLAGTQPRRPLERITTLAMLALGSCSVVAGVLSAVGWLVGIGTSAMLVGVALVARQAFAPLADPLARRHHIVTVTYGAALVMLAMGIAIGGLGAIGVPPVVAAWAQLRPAHAWLGLFGAVSLTIFATLVYLAPTVLGARIRPSGALAAGAAGMLVGPPLTAVGFILGAAPAVAVGMAATLVGAAGQIGYLADVVRRRGPFTSEHDWRRVSWMHLVAGAGWYAAAVAVGFLGVLAGEPVRGWSIGALAVPMVAGWMLQELIGSWTHLAPSVTPGTAAQHARQRRLLAVASRTRLASLNLGVGLAWAGIEVDAGIAIGAGAVLVGATTLLSLVLLLRALTVTRP